MASPGTLPPNTIIFTCYSLIVLSVGFIFLILWSKYFYLCISISIANRTDNTGILKVPLAENHTFLLRASSSLLFSSVAPGREKQ